MSVVGYEKIFEVSGQFLALQVSISVLNLIQQLEEA